MKKNIFTLSILLLLGVSCKEYVALEYENDPALYFAFEQYGQRDSLSQSFFQIPGDGPDTVYVKLQTMGNLYDFNRPFKLEQTNAGQENAAVAGVHYVAFDDPQVAKYFAIPANTATYSLPIILLRDKSLESMEARLELGIVDNEHFRPGIPTWTTFLVKTTATINKPALWDTRWRYQFGASWGPVKMKFIIDVTGYTEWDFIPADYTYLTFLRSKVIAAFQEYNLANPENPMKEADGTLVSVTS